jgi:hypothetical protein
MANLPLTENDLTLLKLYNIPRDEYEPLDTKGRKKRMKEGVDSYMKAQEYENQTEFFETAKTVLPEIKKQFENPPTVIYKKITKVKGVTNTSYLKCQVIGYSAKDKKFVTINPNSDAEVPNTNKISETDIMTSADDMK